MSVSVICAKCGNRVHDLTATSCRVCGAELEAPVEATTARTSSYWSDTRSWRRHLLQRLGAPPVELREGQGFVFGRSSGCDLPIKSVEISRRHAEVIWEDKTPLVRDLGSENGTLINGKRISERALEDGDKLELGPFVCTYRCLTLRGSVKQHEESLEDSQADTQTMFSAGMTGRLEEISLYELLETLSYNQKTGTLEIYAPWGSEGRVSIMEGVALHAEVGDLRGEGAIFGLLRWTEGNFRFIAGVAPDLVPNVRPTMQEILAEARRRMPG